jgi:dihydroorotate dehydrogenase
MLPRVTWAYRTLLRPLLFRRDSETIHNRTLARLAWAGRHPSVCAAMSLFFRPQPLPVQLFGLKFPNPVGLAAGMDKDAAAVPAWAAMGFGFSELGGVTWHPQPGNPAPRMFRAVAHEALVNRMGFNNAGAEALARRLAEWRGRGNWPDHPVGINLGKSKITPLAEAAQDYANSLRVLLPHADFFVVNVSSPNTPNLRQLQDKSALDEILAALQEVNRSSTSSALDSPKNSEVGTRCRASSPASSGNSTKPILVKVAPDLSYTALDEILELVGPRQIAGIVATNTTIARPAATEPELQRIYAEAGGLSGRPLAAHSTEVVRHVYHQTRGRLPIIGVGGIFSAADAWEKITAGASLVQIYTGLVYEGPSVVKKIVSGLRSQMQSDGFASLTDAVGSAEKPG